MGTMASQITSLTIVSQPLIQAQIKENIKAPRHWPLCGEFTSDRWSPRTNGQYCWECFHLMTSSWNNTLTDWSPGNLDAIWKIQISILHYCLNLWIWKEISLRYVPGVPIVITGSSWSMSALLQLYLHSRVRWIGHRRGEKHFSFGIWCGLY